MGIGEHGTAGAGTDRPRVVVGVDGSACAESALRYAMIAAARRGTELGVVSSFGLELYWTGGAPLQIPDIEAIRPRHGEPGTRTGGEGARGPGRRTGDAHR